MCLYIKTRVQLLNNIHYIIFKFLVNKKLEDDY